VKDPASPRIESEEPRKDAAAFSPATVPAPAGLAPGTSNAAVSAWVARSTKSAAAASDRETMEALEGRMDAIVEAASARSTSLSGIGDRCVEDLQAAAAHLRQSNESYDAAHDQFMAVLDAADERFEFEEAIIDSVQGVLIAAALALLGPEMLLVGGAVRAIEEAAVRNSGKLAAHGFKAAATALEGGAGEVAEQAVGGGIGGAVKPGSTAAAGGPTPGDKYEQAFGKLDEIIGVMPTLGAPATLAKDIALAAADVRTEAARLGAGGTGKWTAAEAERKADAVDDVNDASSGDLLNAKLAGGQVLGLKNAILDVEIDDADVIERRLWTTWMATLERGTNEVLDNDVIQEYLTGKGLIEDVGYMSDEDQAAIAGQARRDWLTARGLEVPERKDLVDNLYRREMKLDELGRRLLGKHGVISAVNRVAIDGKTYHCTGMMGGEVGDEVVVSFIRVKDHLLEPGTLIAHWLDTDYEVMGNTAEALEHAGRG